MEYTNIHTSGDKEPRYERIISCTIIEKVKKNGIKMAKR